MFARVHSIVGKARAFLAQEAGASAMVYSVMLAVIIIVVLATVASIGTKVDGTYNAVAGQLPM